MMLIKRIPHAVPQHGAYFFSVALYCSFTEVGTDIHTYVRTWIGHQRSSEGRKTFAAPIVQLYGVQLSVKWDELFLIWYAIHEFIPSRACEGGGE